MSIQEGLELKKNGEEAIKDTSYAFGLFGSKPDYLIATDRFQRAANLFKKFKQFDLAKESFIQLALCHCKLESFYLAGNAYENAQQSLAASATDSLGSSHSSALPGSLTSAVPSAVPSAVSSSANSAVPSYANSYANSSANSAVPSAANSYANSYANGESSQEQFELLKKASECFVMAGYLERAAQILQKASKLPIEVEKQIQCLQESLQLYEQEDRLLFGLESLLELIMILIKQNDLSNALSYSIKYEKYDENHILISLLIQLAIGDYSFERYYQSKEKVLKLLTSIEERNQEELDDILNGIDSNFKPLVSRIRLPMSLHEEIEEEGYL